MLFYSVTFLKKCNDALRYHVDDDVPCYESHWDSLVGFILLLLLFLTTLARIIIGGNMWMLMTIHVLLRNMFLHFTKHVKAHKNVSIIKLQQFKKTYCTKYLQTDVVNFIHFCPHIIAQKAC